MPDILHTDDRLLQMSRVETSDGVNASVQFHAAELLADLHGIRSDAYGLEWDSLIGGLHQPNLPSSRWVDFFRDQRLRFMGSESHAGRQAPGVSLYSRLEAFAPVCLIGTSSPGGTLCALVDSW